MDQAATDVVLSGHGLTEDQLEWVARHGARARLDEACLERRRATRAYVEALAAGDVPVYGISVGFARWRPCTSDVAAQPVAAQPDPVARR